MLALAYGFVEVGMMFAVCAIWITLAVNLVRTVIEKVHEEVETEQLLTTLGFSVAGAALAVLLKMVSDWAYSFLMIHTSSMMAFSASYVCVCVITIAMMIAIAIAARRVPQQI